ncbi:MAG: c-type cytochrome domain-containing protein [Planctomycetaceae bacterium]
MPIGRTLWATLAVAALVVPAFSQEPADAVPAEPVSYYRQVRPILQRHCTGCHQPAKKGGGLVLTSHAELKTGGENGPGFEAGDGEFSNLVTYISGDKPEMPKNAEPLSKDHVALIARWIAEGAKDDTPASVQDTIGPDNPPVYHSPPVVVALRYSPDSKLLAVSGFHEVLLHNADGPGDDGQPVARLVGRSQRVTALEFNHDGTTLAAVGGTPSLFGEVQFWNVADKTLKNSATFGPDTLFGAAFSSDGKYFACGGADNRARILKTEDLGLHVKFDAHSDYVLDLAFSLKNDHLITVSRDMTAKLVVVENGQFVDNITSITPGALKGGLAVVQLRPGQEQILTGGSDGEPKLYQIFRTQDRKIGDDFNRIRAYQPLAGRIFDLQSNADGTKFVVGASTALSGAARIYDVEAGTLLHELKLADGKPLPAPVYAVAFRPDGKQVAVAGFDGFVRLFDVESGSLLKEFSPAPLTPTETAAK